MPNESKKELKFKEDNQPDAQNQSSQDSDLPSDEPNVNIDGPENTIVTEGYDPSKLPKLKDKK